MINRPKAIEDYSGLCFKCIQKKDVVTYRISGRGYGSWFDSFNTKLQLCSACKPEGIEEWFNEDSFNYEMLDDYRYESEEFFKEHGDWIYTENYKYEQNIYDFVDTLPLEGRELFKARCATGACAGYMFGQDWIDYKLGVLPEYKCKEYGYYAPYRLKVARERFELCNEPVNKIYGDGSKGCWCPWMAHGEYGQKAGPNTGDTCYDCEFFCLRYEPIKEMADKKYDKYAEIKRAKAVLERFHEDQEMENK